MLNMTQRLMSEHVPVNTDAHGARIGHLFGQTHMSLHPESTTHASKHGNTQPIQSNQVAAALYPLDVHESSRISNVQMFACSSNLRGIRKEKMHFLKELSFDSCE